MKLEWMDENSGVMEALIRCCNIYAGMYRTEKMEYMGVSYSYSQIQVIAYLIENEERGENMACIAKRLGVTRSNFTKIIQRLEQKGIVEKKCMPGCKRDHCVEVTAFGRALYENYSQSVLRTRFTAMFREFEKLSPEARDHVVKALLLIDESRGE